ncbi:MAG: hypothetical protein ACE5OQ_15760, partial [Woeseia sp.]
ADKVPYDCIRAGTTPRGKVSVIDGPHGAIEETQCFRNAGLVALPACPGCGGCSNQDLVLSIP